ncbi:MAG: GSU2403 family nucleotidyltransferase fold protein [Acidaminococcaceae bacterium]
MSMPEDTQIKAFDDLIKALYDANVLDSVLIIGSWAEYIYVETGLLDYQINMRTQDIDVLICNKNKPRASLNKILVEHGFELLVDPSGLMKYDKSGEIEVEFLVREMGKGQIEPYKTEMGVTAQGLRYMDILIDNQTHAIYKGFSVCIPKPAAYVLHKLIINKDREEYKKEKDAEAISNILLFAANEDFIFELKMFFELQNEKTKGKMIATCSSHPSLYEFLNVFSD